MSLFDRLESSGHEDPPFIVVYGVDGIGKTTLAMEAEGVVYLRTRGESAPRGVEVPQSQIKDYIDLKDSILDLIDKDHDFKWLVIDSLDGLEPLVWQETCYLADKENIESFGYGRGYVEADKLWGELLDLLVELKESGVGIIILAHPSIERFDSPITEPYNRYTIKIHKRANSLIREAADIVAFMNHRVAVKDTQISRDKKVSHAVGKARMIYLTGTAAFDAKNRYSMPDEIEYRKGHGFSKLQEFFPKALGQKRR